MIYNSTLTSIEFKRSIITHDSSITKLCTGCPRLQKLTLDCSGSASKFEGTDASVRAIAKYCPDINTLSLKGWSKLADLSMTALSSLINLREINLSKCIGLTSGGLQGILKSKNIEVITLLDEGVTSPWNYCDDALLRCIGEYCPLLRTLSIAIHLKVAEASLVALAQGCPLLDALTVRCYKKQLTDNVLIELSTSCPRLRKLKFSGGNYTDVGIEALLSKCTLLESFDLSHNSMITDEAIISIASNCKNLNILFLHNIKLVTDKALCQVFKSCTQLTSISLAQMPLITDSSILALTRHLPNLKILILVDNPRLTDKSMISLATLHDLSFLCIHSCSSLSDDTVRSIARHCCMLTDVNVRKCPLMTEQSLIAFITHGMRLQTLKISGIKLTPRIKATYLTKRSSSRRTSVILGSDSYLL